MSKKIPTNNFRKTPKPESGDFVFAKNNLFLYQVVYGSAVSAGLVFLLLFSFFVQGVEKVYAGESSSDSLTVLVVSDDSTEVQIERPIEITETQIAMVQTQEQTPTETGLVNSASLEAEDDLDLLDQEKENNVVSGHELETSDVAAEDFGEFENTGTDQGQSTSSDPKADVLVDEIDLTENVTFEAVSYTKSDSLFSFNKDECTKLASGSFYCYQSQENTLDDALFSAPDADGDLEIFLVRGGIETQVTNNTMDDAAPYFDRNTGTLVWHRLIDDRFQIISFDIDSREETQLTRTAENNMEPNRQGDYTVWQRWVDGGWNIILHDGESEKQITKTTSHNIAPYVHGSLVVWNRYGSTNERTIEMYDIQSQSYVSVEDPDGMSVSNPRMVFVYDSLHPNGDIVTRGFDVLAREFIDLDTMPRDLPDEIPASDSTGETRALIQSKPSLKSDTKESFGDLGTTSTSLLPTMPTSTEALTLDLTIPNIAVTSNQNTATSSSVQADLVIAPYIPLAKPTTESVQE